MIKIKGFKGNRSLKITHYKILLDVKISQELVNSGPIWKLNNSFGLVYEFKILKSGNLCLILGTGATRQLTNIQQVKNKASKILNLISANITNCVNDVLLTQPKYKDLVIKALNGNSNAQKSIAILIENLSILANRASNDLYVKALNIKDCKNELEK
jgi:hypothetical protein